MLNLLKVELRSSKFKWANIIVVLNTIFKIVLVFISKNSKHIYINEIYTGAFLLLVLYFMDTQSDKIDIIMNSIPIDKRTLVLSKYLIVLISFLISLIYTILYFGFLKILGFCESDFMNLRHIVVSLSIFFIYSSVVLPIYHISPILFYGSGPIFFITTRSIVNNNMVSIEKLFLGQNSLIFFLVSIIILIISMLISVHNYKKREFVRG